MSRSPLPAILITLAVTAAAGWALLQSYQRGQDAGAAQVQQRWDQQQALQARRHAQALDTLRQRGNALQDQLHQQDSRRHQERTHAQSQIQRLRAAVRSAAVRLSIPTTGPACPAAPGPEGASPAARPEQARAELAPEAADALVSIAADGDSAIRDLNACIDRYEAVRQAINAPLATP